LSELELCPVCKKGYLRPTGEVATNAEAKEPFRETGSMRKLVCDNPECESKRASVGINEYIPVSATPTLEVTKAEDLQKMKNNPNLCTVCQNEKEIVYRKENVKLCRECLDNIKHQDER